MRNRKKHLPTTNDVLKMDPKASASATAQQEKQKELAEREKRYAKLRAKLWKEQARRERDAPSVEEQHQQEVWAMVMEAHIEERPLPASEESMVETAVLRDAEQDLRDVKVARLEDRAVIVEDTMEAWNETSHKPHASGRITLRRKSYKERLEMEAEARRRERRKMLKEKEGRKKGGKRNVSRGNGDRK